MDAQAQEKLKVIERWLDLRQFNQQIELNRTTSTKSIHDDVDHIIDFLLRLVREQETEIIKWQEACWSKDDQIKMLETQLAKYERAFEGLGVIGQTDGATDSQKFTLPIQEYILLLEASEQFRIAVEHWEMYESEFTDVEREACEKAREILDKLMNT